MGAAMIGSSVFSKAIVTVFSHPHDCGMAACPLPFLHSTQVGRRSVRSDEHPRGECCAVARQGAAEGFGVRGAAQRRGMSIGPILREMNVGCGALGSRVRCNTPRNGEVAMRGRNQSPTKPTKFAVEFWDQIRAGRD